jgi:hypothetical protein
MVDGLEIEGEGRALGTGGAAVRRGEGERHTLGFLWLAVLFPLPCDFFWVLFPALSLSQ